MLLAVDAVDERGAAPAPLFEVRLFGGFEVRTRDGASVERWPLEKSRELLAFLLAHGGASVSREVVAEALWPGIEWDGSLKHSLSNAASTLRSTLRAAAGDGEIQPLIALRQRLQVPPGLFAVDLDAFDAALRHAASLPEAEALDEYDRALGLCGGDFLEGEFFAWVDPYRLDYRQRMLDVARKAAGLAERMGDWSRSASLIAGSSGGNRPMKTQRVDSCAALRPPAISSGCGRRSEHCPRRSSASSMIAMRHPPPKRKR